MNKMLGSDDEEVLNWTLGIFTNMFYTIDKLEEEGKPNSHFEDFEKDGT